MKILGVDASSRKTGIGVFNDGSYITHTLIDHTKEKDIMKRIPMMINDICKYIKEQSPDKVLMEETMLASNTDTLKKLAYLAGGIMFYCHVKDIEFELVLPSSWRRIVGLQQSNKIKREVLKVESMTAVKQEYGLDVNDDVADAILIARSAFNLPKINIKADAVDMSLKTKLE